MDDTAVDDGLRGGASGMSLWALQTTHPGLDDTSTLRRDLEPALGDLSSRQRQVLSLRYFAGLDEIEISEALGISVKAVRKYATHGTAALRARGVIRGGNLVPG
jgi:DNA-directed RNA polymerase specialized sigma24 family protein